MMYDPLRRSRSRLFAIVMLGLAALACSDMQMEPASTSLLEARTLVSHSW